MNSITDIISSSSFSSMISAPKAEGDENAEGVCRYHGPCIEGLACAEAIAKRKGIKPSELASLSDDDEVWVKWSHYLAHLCLNLTLTVSPHVIVIGGGVLQRLSLLPLIRSKFVKLLNNYIEALPNSSRYHIGTFIII